MSRDDLEAAYFTLLRAREELASLHAYDEVLRTEAQRLRRGQAEGAALLAQVDPRMLRPLRHTEQPLAEAIAARLAVIEDERARLPDRVSAAEAHVEACELEHALRRGEG